MIWGLEGSYKAELACDKNYFKGDNTDIQISIMKVSFETSLIA
jgi:hypothetical protein